MRVVTMNGKEQVSLNADNDHQCTFERITPVFALWRKVEQLILQPDLTGIDNKIKSWERDRGCSIAGINDILSRLPKESAYVAFEEYKLSDLQIEEPLCVDVGKTYLQFPIVAFCTGDGIPENRIPIPKSEQSALHNFLSEIGFKRQRVEKMGTWSKKVFSIKELEDMQNIPDKMFRFYELEEKYEEVQVRKELVHNYLKRF